MYAIIAGAGRLGKELATSMADKGNDIVVIDQNGEAFNKFGNGFNGLSITGIPFDEDVLKQAGIQKADVVAAVTSDDNVNIMISQIAKMLYRVPKIITRISDPDKVATFRSMGFEVICPTAVAASEIEHKLEGRR